MTPKPGKGYPATGSLLTTGLYTVVGGPGSLENPGKPTQRSHDYIKQSPITAIL